MRKIEYNCDRCGKQISNPHACYSPTYCTKDYSARIDFFNIGVQRTNPQRMDLCPECCEKFINFLEGEENG